MTNCPSCQHPRLVHDTWGCKMQCSCAVSIVYLTTQLLLQSDQTAENHVIDLGNLLVQQADRREESRFSEMYERPSVLDSVSPAEQLQ